MSAIKLPGSTADYKPASIKQPSAPLVDANKILERAVQKLSAGARNTIVLRCDDLPSLQGSEECIETAFSYLLQLITEKKDEANPAYLHISSTAAPVNDFRLSNGSGLNRFLVRFHTNLTPDKEWLKTGKQKMNAIASMLASYDGSMAVKQLKNSGCFFYISLPGKL